MEARALEALHDVHTATNDVITGYREMNERAEPDIKPLMQRLTEMHQRHAASQQAELHRLRNPAQDDTSLQGTVNKVVVILRDWLSDLDKDVLPAVRQGEESLRDAYTDALEDAQVREHAVIAGLLQSQMADIDAEIARLPAG